MITTLRTDRVRRSLASPSRREEILSAARRLIAESGVRGTSMRDLAREVGVTEGALYRHFDSKEALVGELFAAEASRLHGWLARSLDRGADAWGQLASLVRGFAEFGLRETEGFRLIMEVHHTAGLKPEQRVRLPRELFAEVLMRIASDEKASFEDLPAVVFIIVGMLSRTLTGLRQGMVRLPETRAVELLIRASRGAVAAALVPLS